MTATKQTKGLRIDGFATVVATGTSSCGGPGETPYVRFNVRGKEWTWFAQFEDVLYIPIGTTGILEAFGYEQITNGARLRRVRFSIMDNDGNVTYYGMKP